MARDQFLAAACLGALLLWLTSTEPPSAQTVDLGGATDRRTAPQPLPPQGTSPPDGTTASAPVPPATAAAGPPPPAAPARSPAVPTTTAPPPPPMPKTATAAPGAFPQGPTDAPDTLQDQLRAMAPSLTAAPPGTSSPPSTGGPGGAAGPGLFAGTPADLPIERTALTGRLKHMAEAQERLIWLKLATQVAQEEQALCEAALEGRRPAWCPQEIEARRKREEAERRRREAAAPKPPPPPPPPPPVRAVFGRSDAPERYTATGKGAP